MVLKKLLSCVAKALIKLEKLDALLPFYANVTVVAAFVISAVTLLWSRTNNRKLTSSYKKLFSVNTRKLKSFIAGKLGYRWQRLSNIFLWKFQSTTLSSFSFVPSFVNVILKKYWFPALLSKPSYFSWKSSLESSFYFRIIYAKQRFIRFLDYFYSIIIIYAK